jgi:hypothetical protein
MILAPYVVSGILQSGIDTHFLLSSFLSKGEVNSGLDDKRLAIVNTIH